MAKTKDGPSKSQAIRDVLKVNPKMPAREVVNTLATKGVKVTTGLVYYIKGKAKGRKGRRHKLRAQAATLAASNGMGDAVSVVLKVKKLASELGGMSKLKALVEALHS